jgi:hypothetical protein
MSKKAQKETDYGLDRNRKFRLADLLVILLCLSGAVFFINLFRIDLFSTLDSKNEKPVGTIIVKNNIVQRRMANRVLWDRLTTDSPAYMGDLIRTADISYATLDIESNSLELGEKTLIRIQRSPDGEGLIQIDLVDGNLGLSTGSDGGNIVLNIMGRQVKTGPETILHVSTGKDGMVVRVSKGIAEFTDGGRAREIATGAMVSLDADGVEKMEKAAVAIQPRPNARYLKNDTEPLRVNFIWSGVNLDSGERLRLEIAGDRNFNRIIQVIENLTATAGGDVAATLDAGPWYWRLSSMESWAEPLAETAASSQILLTERFVITEASGPDLFSPVTDTLFRYQNDLPQLRFHWSEMEHVSYYVLEASETPDFTNTWIRMQTASVYLLDSSLGQGTWYWRVLPVFPSAWEGGAAFSPASYFHMEQNAALEVALVLPELVPPEPVTEQPQPVIEPPKPVPVRLRLLSPSSGTSLAGLTALRQQTVFRWSGEGDIERSRFVLSKNRNPLQGRPEVEIANPGGTIRLNRLTEGTYYWTVEARGADGLVSAAPPRRLRVLPVPLLPAPGNLQPPAGHRVGIEHLTESESISFSWSAVRGANAYVLTLYEETDNGRRQIVGRPPENRTEWVLDNLGTLGRGSFSWRVEAVNRGSSGAVEQRGAAGEGSFVIDIPRPSRIEIEDPGILYGY